MIKHVFSWKINQVVQWARLWNQL